MERARSRELRDQFPVESREAGFRTVALNPLAVNPWNRRCILRMHDTAHRIGAARRFGATR
jgi:hypothetical protein